MKKILSAIFYVILTTIALGQTNSKFQLSSHILNITTGQPIENVTIKLQKLNNHEKWETIDSKKTDKNGRVIDFLPYLKNTNKGIYKLIFETAIYFKNNNIETFYPFIEVVFSIQDNKHYHVPITVSPFGYSTYKGN